MEEIIKKLEKIVNYNLDECEKIKKVPSKDVLDAINVLNIISRCC